MTAVLCSFTEVLWRRPMEVVISDSLQSTLSSLLKALVPQTHFLTSYTENPALVTSTKQNRKSKYENIKQTK